MKSFPERATASMRPGLDRQQMRDTIADATETDSSDIPEFPSPDVTYRADDDCQGWRTGSCDQLPSSYSFPAFRTVCLFSIYLMFCYSYIDMSRYMGGATWQTTNISLLIRGCRFPGCCLNTLLLPRSQRPWTNILPPFPLR